MIQRRDKNTMQFFIASRSVLKGLSDCEREDPTAGYAKRGQQKGTAKKSIVICTL